MTGLEEETHNDKRGYFLSATLVNRLIISIISAIFVIGGYMIAWAWNDAAYKAEQAERLENIEGVLSLHLSNHPDQVGNFAVNIAELKATQQAHSRQLERIENLIRANGSR